MLHPHIVGNAFAQKYYNHQRKCIDFIFDDSVLGRPVSNGEMVSDKSFLLFAFCRVLTSRSCPFDYENSKIQILTADSQASYKNGVVTLVTHGFAYLP